MRKFPSSGERNFRIARPEAGIAAVVARYEAEKVRGTEPLVRLNLESAGNPDLVQQKLTEIEMILEGFQ